MYLNKIVNSKYYNISLALLSLLVIITLFIELTFNLPLHIINLFSFLNSIIWIVFVLDYTFRLFVSNNKKNFILNNKIDLIAILPFNELLKGLKIFKSIRLFKLTKLLRMTAFISNYMNRLKLFICLNNFNYVIYITVFTILIGAASISIVENMSFSDSLWWSFVTTTTVGYGDISPVTSLGRVIATVLMLVGIGFISMLTGTIATFFISKKDIKKDFKTETLNNISTKIKDDFDNLTIEDLDNIFCILKSLKKKKE